jgi:hypothetical protein
MRDTFSQTIHRQPQEFFSEIFRNPTYSGWEIYAESEDYANYS